MTVTRIRNQNEPDEDEIRKFLDFLDTRKSNVIHIISFTDSKEVKFKRGEDPLGRHFRNKSHASLVHIMEYNRDGAGIYAAINEVKRGCQVRKNNVTHVRFLVLDYDGSGNDPLVDVIGDLMPSCIVRTSQNKWHAYIEVEGIPLHEFPRMQLALAEFYGTDDSVINVNRVMRVPGTVHMKDPSHPYLVTASYPDDFKHWTYEELLDMEFMRTCEEQERVIRDRSNRIRETPEEVEAIMANISTTCREGNFDYGEWIKIGMALHDWDEVEGYDYWRRHSIEDYGDNYDTEEAEEERQQKWEGFGRGTNDPLTLASYSRQYGDPTIGAQKDFAEYKGKASRERRNGKTFMDIFSSLCVTSDIVERDKNRKRIAPGMMHESSVTLIAAPPGTGKTGIIFELLNRQEIYDNGYTTLYIHVDIKVGALGLGYRYQERSNGHFKYCTPTAIDEELTGKDVFKMLSNFADSKEDMSKIIVVLDSLADFEADVTKDTAIKKTMNVLKKMAVCGATVIVLAHTTKYVDPISGMLYYKGSQILAAAVDNVINLVPVKRKEDAEYEMSPIMEEEKADRERLDNEILSYEVTIVSFSEVLVKNRDNINPQQSWIVAYGLAAPLPVYVKPETRNRRIAQDESIEQDYEIGEYAQVYQAMIEFHKMNKRYPNYTEVKAFRLALGIGHVAMVEVIRSGKDAGYWTVEGVDGKKKNEKRYVPANGLIIVGGELKAQQIDVD